MRHTFAAATRHDTACKNGAMTDPFLWLEDVTAERSLDWVRERNARTLAEYTENAEFSALESRILDVLDTDDRIPYAGMRGEYLYNFWRDGDHKRGIWRRTTLEQYRTENPEWDVLLDVDALAEREDENWVWAGASVLRPEQSRALLSFSRGGADASVVREFDIEKREFVGGDHAFDVPEAKTSISWIDTDTVYVGTDFGEGSMTDSGYPRIAKRWHRGTPLTEAVTVFEGETTDVSVGASYDDTPGYERHFVGRSMDFYNSERYQLLPDGSKVRIDTPDDAGSSVYRDWLTIRPRTDWDVDGTVYPAGSLLAANYADFLAGSRELTPLFTPDEHTSLEQGTWTRNHLLLVRLSDVQTKLSVLTPNDTGWEEKPLDGVPELTASGIISTDPRTSDSFFVNSSGFTTPATLLYGTVGGPLEPVKQAPSFFDADGMSVAQHFAVSDDGTEIPYFVVRRDDVTGPCPTMLYGYGGFENSMVPGYSGSVGFAWLERGGAYVVANIRGGGEYGPSWHTQAVREGRHKAFEDFAAVARDLVARGITTSKQLGIQGGSNGGLLMGVMLTRYPELFGAIVCQVPLLDMKRYHLLLAGASWMAEYGDPDNPDDWKFISEYSPYQNTDATADYPPILVTTSTRDDRVHPGHARKMTALLEKQGHEVWYYENIEGGHGGAADNAQAAFKSALTFTFLWEMLTRP
ncbi:prolyl oligopeptidase family serine peptidase [Rhodococcus opacus]|uniref:Prolyl oligopeptidase family serine peptidase n=2 Tax=Rhodococcus opacus TaxID=37919 RepID=A0AAX3YSJ4_RHOOP|nr:prolyl oligopeptidase family serine peptidase [Rhodococcus opacus]MCZ4589746.1 prolyl oligopeptidase family serine peptidase [Rhodococcus opacus]MDJ0413265.1 prolyl oligopeptidase family serine peptidase [Rhodococcus opacus]MDX5966788.1 prolyl oligopeptidase family serine peptidase [Rhodococcus opacus]UZG59515.1 prolyl oligopeptidase family serine peptidase [Rhodococcus opacus]WKN59339.1 prolyl oligopeptidase family serine peptidase [Rhodococcus opacus]